MIVYFVLVTALSVIGFIRNYRGFSRDRDVTTKQKMITGHGTKLLYIYQQATFSEAASSKQPAVRDS